MAAPSPAVRYARALLLALWGAAWLQAASAVKMVHVPRRVPRYLFATFPNTPEIAYSLLPHTSWNPLVIEGLVMPQAISVDPDKQRVFVADTMAGLILAYKFRILGSGRLMVDGPRHVLSKRIVARGLFTDATGSLYMAGQQTPDPALVPPGSAIEPLEAVFTLKAQDIDRIMEQGLPLDPTQLWLRTNTGSAGAPASPQLYTASCITGDAISLFWGNAARPDAITGAVASAGTSVPALQPEETVRALADNVERVSAIALTPTYVFYAGEGKVYGVSRHKASATCGQDGALCPPVLVQTDQALRPTTMLWDGDGTIYVAEPSIGALLSFSAGSLSPHVPTKVADASGVWGLAYYMPTSGAAPAARRLGAIILSLVVAALGSASPARP